MRRSLISPDFKSLPLGLCGAILGFSWAYATIPGNVGARQTTGENRSVGSGVLNISNPPLPSNSFDLGDACFGSLVTRYVSALGGIRPFVFAPVSGQNTIPGISIDRLGRVSGTVQAGSPFKTLTASVTDSTFAKRSGNFILNSVAFPASIFRFAIDSLPSAQSGQDYITNIQVINQDVNTVFSAVDGSIAFNGITIPSLEFLGLTLFRDGLLAGRPLAAGTLTFTARATRNGLFASNRSGSALDQQYSIVIAPAISIQSVLATNQATINDNQPNSLAFQININLNGATRAILANNNFIFRFAGQTFQTTLDSSGQSRQSDFRVSLKAPIGQLQIRLRNQNLFKYIPQQDQLVSGSRVIVVTEIEIGNAFIGTEAIQFDVRARAGHRQLNYDLGADRQVGGLFQITRLQGKDSQNGSAFQANFLIAHVKGQTDIQFGTPKNAIVRIGPGFVQPVDLTLGNVPFPAPGVRTLLIETNRKTGILTTYPLNVSQTNAQFAHNSAGNTQIFTLGIDLHTSTVQFTGEGSRQIFAVQPFLP